MDFFNKAAAQLTELVRSMSPGTRLATGLLLVVVVVSIGYLFQYQVTSGDEYLLDGRPFSGAELTNIESAFAQAGLGKSTVDGNRIRIPRGQKEIYLAALAENDALPADFYRYLDEAAASDTPFTSSRSMEMKKWNAKQKELALIISRMKGVEAATVQYDEELKGGLTRSKQKTAMVAVQTAGGALEDAQLKSIRNVIASAYAGLDRRDITVTDMTSGLSYGGGSSTDGSMSEEDSIYAAHKQKYERDWQRKIADQLAMIPGVIVGVNVELSPELSHQSQTIKLDAKPVAVESNEFTKEQSSTSPSPAGRPGAIPNGVGNQPVAVNNTSSANESQTSESRSEVRNVPGHEQTVMKRAPLVPTVVTASIDIPASYFTRIWRERNPQPAGAPPKQPDAAEIAKIETETKGKVQETVRNLLPPVSQGTNPYPHIAVATYTDLPGSPMPEASIAETATAWFGSNWQTLAVLGVGMFALVMLRSMTRPLPLPPAPANASSSLKIADTDADDDEEAASPASALRRRLAGGPNIKDELRDMVKEDPDAAANILRNWIGDAA